MVDFLKSLVNSDFMPHGHCYFWTPGLVWLQVVTNASIGLAYVSISLTLAYLVRRIQDIPFQWVYVAFGIFIITCGITHFMDVWVIWNPTYWLDGAIRLVTAVASVGTALLLFPLVPKAVTLAGTARLAHERGLRLEQLNVELEALYERTRETIAESIPQLVWTTTPDGNVDYFNKRWREYTGELPWQSVVHPDDAERVLGRWKECLESGQAYEVELRLRRKDGLYRWFLARACPLRDKTGRIVKWLGANTDIQEQKLVAEEREVLLQRAREAVRARDVFLAIAAHELKTPLTPLRLETQSLLRAVHANRLTPERLGEKLSTMDRQMDRLDQLVTDLLDVARIAGGRFELTLEHVDLAEVVRDVVERYAKDLPRDGTVSVDVAPGIIGYWDRGRIDQVVTNLLTNAIKYGRGAPITIEGWADDTRAWLEITDRGIGIAPEHRERIFGQFERAVSERHYGGLGLGLWITRQVVEALGGTVTVKSEVDVGSIFTVQLPRQSKKDS